MRSAGGSSSMWNICTGIPARHPRRWRSVCVWIKRTLTKTIKKLSEVGYIRVESDGKDRRVKHLYLTEKAVPAAEQIRKIHADFYHTLSKDMDPSEITERRNRR